MKEAFISYIWFNKLFFEHQETLMGEKVEIVSPGIANNDAGPDVFNAKVKIDGQLWAGNVEFHVKASDWHLHNHDEDKNYQHIILHVVLEADEQIVTMDEKPIPTIELKFPEFILRNYTELTKVPFGCDSTISRIDKLHLVAWLERLAIERLEAKVENIECVVNSSTTDWDQVLYVLLARAIGTNVNGEAMQQLAMAVPLRHLRHLSDNQLQIEAMLLGTAGLIERLADTYNKELYRREYRFLKEKFGLCAPLEVFRFSRMRPANFPTVKIMQLAAMIRELPAVESLIGSEGLKVEELRKKPELHLINCYLPCLFLYAERHNYEEMKEQVVDMMHTLPPERNFITRHFQTRGISAHNAAESQALIQLYRRYCEMHNCLQCRFAHELINRRR